jgi:hypothetical protein
MYFIELEVKRAIWPGCICRTADSYVTTNGNVTGLRLALFHPNVSSMEDRNL